MPTYKTLADLLTALFTALELLHWIGQIPDGAYLLTFLSEGKAVAFIAADADALLRRHGRVDAALFESLVNARPGRADEIRTFAAPVLAAAAAGASVSAALSTPPSAPTSSPSSAPPPTRPPSTADAKLADLADLIAKRQVLVICGAGVSLAATGGAATAGWAGLLRVGVEHCRNFAGADDRWCKLRIQLLDEGDTADWIHVAQQITAKLGGPSGGEFRSWLRTAIGALRATDSTLLQAIAALGCPIATTNYDDLLEAATGLRAVSWDEGAEVERGLRGDEPGILHLHGHWRRPESLVLGVESYLAVRDAPHAVAVRQALKTTRSLLFIGCGDTTRDPNIGAWLRWSGDVFAGSEYRNYRLERDGDVASVQALHPPAQRLFVLGYGTEHAELPGFLRGLVARA